MEQQLVTFKELGAPVMVYAETTGSVQGQQQTPVSKRPRLPPGDFKDYGAKLTVLAEYMPSASCPWPITPYWTIVETRPRSSLADANTGTAVGLLGQDGQLGAIVLEIAGGKARPLADGRLLWPCTLPVVSA